MTSKPIPVAPASAQPDAVSALVPFAHVADVEQSLAFYALLGFTRQSSHQGPTGRTVWADAAAGAARLMLAQASGPIAADEQAVLFYMYSKNVASLRARLLASGVHDGGPFHGDHAPATGPTTHNDRRVAFSISHPFYMPAGELRVHDPDGYVLLIGQL